MQGTSDSSSRFLYKLEARHDTIPLAQPNQIGPYEDETCTMGTRILGNAMILTLCVLVISDASISGNQEGRNLDFKEEEDETLFSPLTERVNNPGSIPIVNPTTPGTTTPIVNPVAPSPPANAGGFGPTPTVPTGPVPTGPIPTAPIGGFGPTPTVPTGPVPTGPIPPAPTGQTPTGPVPTAPTASGSGSWCIANPSASQTALQVALDYACGYGGTDCSALQQNGACYNPNTVHDHASYAFNSYYQKNPSPTSCVFGGAAQLTNTDPSRGSCRFASSSTTQTPPTGVGASPTIPMTPMMPTVPITPPSTSTPMTPYAPGGNGLGSVPTGSDYGAEPTGTPSAAHSVSANLILFITINCLMLTVTVANHF